MIDFHEFLGYKLRTQMAKKLQKRSKAIRRAISTYNKAAKALTPPRPTLAWTDVSHYGLVEQYALLKASNPTLGTREWTQPVFRDMLKSRRRIARAREEILRCNVETRRLHTSIYDDTAHFKNVLQTLRDANSPTYGAVAAFARRRNRVHKVLLKRVYQIQALVGFTGESSRGVHVDRNGDNEWEDVPIPLEEDALRGDEDEDVGSDDELHQEIRGIEAFVCNGARDN